MKRFFLICVLSGFIFSGCGKDEEPQEEPQEEPKKEQVQDVMVYLSTGSFSNTGPESTVISNESQISKLILFGVDDKNKFITAFPIITNPSMTGIKLTVPIEVKTIHAIANPTLTIESINLSTFSDIFNLTCNFTTAPTAPFIMSGKGSVSSARANIELLRIVAKIEVVAHNDFVIESITVKKTPDKGYVFKKETSEPPTSASVSYPANTTNFIVYVAENTKNNPSEFEVAGKYRGQPVSYPIVLENNGSAVNIVRNVRYQINITESNDEDCTFTITMPAWEDINADNYIIPREKNTF